MTLFATMRDFARATKTVRLASPDDILDEIHEWSPGQLELPVKQRGKPIRTRLEIREGAATVDFKIRALSMAERETAEAVLDAVQPARIFIEEAADRPGQPPKCVPAGYDYDDPAYLSKLRPLHERQSAFVALCGVDGLRDSTPGADDAAKTTALMEAMPSCLVKFLAGEIWNMTYAQGDPADFFTSAGSPPSPGSGPSPKPSRPAAKPR